MLFGFSRRNAVRQSYQESCHAAPKRRRLFFDTLEDRRLLSGGSLTTPGTVFTADASAGAPGTQSTSNGSPQAVAVDNAGNAVVAWATEQSNGTFSVLFREFTNNGGTLVPATGTPSENGPVTVASNLAHDNASPNGGGVPPVHVARASGGSFVVLWGTAATKNLVQVYGTHAQLYSAAGAPIGGQITVSGTNSNYPLSAAMNDNGFDLLYESISNKRLSTGVGTDEVQRYSATGSALGKPISVATPNGGFINDGSIGMDAQGNFEVAWRDYSSGHYYVDARRFNSSGQAQGGVIQVQSTTVITDSASLATDPTSGAFVVAWTEHAPTPVNGGSGSNVYASQFSSTGTPMEATSPIPVATVTYATVVGNDGKTYYYQTAGAPDGDSIGLSALPGDNGAFDISWTNFYETLQASTTTQSGYVTIRHDDIYAATYDSTGSLGQSLYVTSDGNSNVASSAAVDANNDLLVVWTAGASGNASTGTVTGIFYLDPPSTSSPTTSPASPSGSNVAATDAVFAAYACPDGNDTLG